jgi:LuxR family transcriptional regulator, glucitol operon activator
MQLNEAVRLLRTLARARHVGDLAKAKAPVLEIYCKKMKLNAGFIKWFLTSVQFGKRPDQVLANPKVFLDFCVAHVFEHVSEDAKLVTKAMLAAPGKQSLPVISYLTGLTGDRLELALASLQSANILRMSTSFGESFSDTVYELSELPRLYILKNNPPSATEDAEFKRRKREVAAIFDRQQAEGGELKYRTKSIACRTPSDSVLARLLVAALDLSNRGEPDAAFEKVAEATSLDASFSEAYRVEALLQQRGGNNIAAEEAYETAVELEPTSAPLRYRYAMFLLRQLHDPSRAYDQLEIARGLDPINARVACDAARCLLYLGNPEEAQKRTDEVLARDDLGLMTGRITLNVYLQASVKLAQDHFGGRRSADGLKVVDSAVQRISSCPKDWFDDRVCKALSSLEFAASQLANQDGSVGALESARMLSEKLNAFVPLHTMRSVGLENAGFRANDERARHIELTAEDVASEIGKRVEGVIDSVFYEKKFGFISGPFGDLFFHFSQVSHEEFIAVGAAVTFVTALNTDGRPIATKIKIAKPHPVIRENDRLSGQVKSAAGSYGFIFGEDGHDYFFHESNVSAGEGIESLEVGTNVVFTAHSNPRGPEAVDVELRD